MIGHHYSDDFYDYIDDGSRRSARIVARLLLGEMRLNSLLDLGSGRGAWVAEWLAAGVTDTLAVDGDYIGTDQLAIPVSDFLAHDLSTPLDLRRKFDLVQSLEVAEHLPLAKAGLFIDNLVCHGDIILFSAAVPHQGGEHHVNEQPPEFWRKEFASRGFAVFDFVRPRLAANHDVMAWYRFNTYLYANQAGEKRLSDAILQSRVAPDVPLKVGGDLSWMLRRAAVRLIPSALISPIAMTKARLEARFKSGA